MFSKLREKLKEWLSKSEKEVKKKAKKVKSKAQTKKAGKKKARVAKLKKAKKEKGKKKKIAKKARSGKLKGEGLEEIKEGTKQGSILQRIKERFVFKISEQEFEELFSELELVLLENNTALEVVDKIKDRLKEELVDKEKTGDIEEKIKEALINSIEEVLPESFDLIAVIKEKIKAGEKPYKIVFFGINGSGKTTTIAKLAFMLKKHGLSCVFAASDTFRAASIEQLEKHAARLGIKVIKQDYGADPAAVAFDAVKYAEAHGIDVVMIDTAGRMHTQENLLREMEKICRVIKPDLRVIVLESIAGNDAIQQVKAFNEAVGIDAIILTKADVDKKGGTALSVSYVTGKPIIFIGTGQDYKDLKRFEKEKILQGLFG